MTNTTTTSEPIAADPVLIDASDAQKSTPNESPSTLKDDVSETSSEDSNEGGFVAEFVTRNSNMPRPPPPRVYRQGRGSPRFIPDRDADEIPIISNTKQFNALLSQPDICVETVGSCDTIYISTTPFHDADVQKLAWIFKIGIPDAWVQKPTSFVSGTGYQFDLPHGRRQYHDDDRYDDGYTSRDIVSRVRLGAVLRMFKDDSEKYGTSKVKFVTAVHKERTTGAWVKLIVSHTRQATAVDIFHQMLNNQSILFVGAVLQDVAVPAETSSRKPLKVQKVNSVKEAEEVGKGVIGVIC